MENKKFEQTRYETDEFYREKPKVIMFGMMFYIDKKKGEYRFVNNPDMKITFGELEVLEVAKNINERINEMKKSLS